jgi:predicted DCC family thiol-disulfide oxidoreductase YuxK
MKEANLLVTQKQEKPILLFDDECAVCRHIAHWVQKLAQTKSGDTTIIERPIGNDPDLLRFLNPDLDIWDAYATIHVLMPDGSMKLGGEAVAEVLRSLPATKWFTGTFAISAFGFRPFQTILNLAYAILADVRPLFGCGSCGTPRLWVRPIHWMIKWTKAIFGDRRKPSPTPYFTVLSATKRRLLPAPSQGLTQAPKLSAQISNPELTADSSDRHTSTIAFTKLALAKNDYRPFQRPQP